MGSQAAEQKPLGHPCSRSLMQRLVEQALLLVHGAPKPIFPLEAPPAPLDAF